MVPFERGMVVPRRLSISYNNLPQFAIECLRRSNQQAVGHFGAKFETVRRKGLIEVSQILTRSGRDRGLSYAKEIVSISSAVWAQCTNVTERRTNRLPNDNTDIGEIVCQRYRLKYFLTNSTPLEVGMRGTSKDYRELR